MRKILRFLIFLHHKYIVYLIMMSSITDIICEYLTSEIILTDEDMDYIRNISHVETLNDFSDFDSCEIDSILEFLIYPTFEFQLKVEKIIGNNVLTEEDLKRILDISAFDSLNLVLGNEKLSINLDTGIIRRFIKRLRLSNDLIKELDIKDITPAELVNLRNSNLKSSKEIKEFYKSLFGTKEKFFDFRSAFELSLKILSDYKCGEIKKHLIEKKLFYSSLIQKDMHFKELMEKHNMETLMMQGVATPSFDVDEAFENIKIINRILGVIYNYYNDSDHEHFQYTNVSISKDVSDILDLFKK